MSGNTVASAAVRRRQRLAIDAELDLSFSWNFLRRLTRVHWLLETIEMLSM
jgi:hypothetical protein